MKIFSWSVAVNLMAILGNPVAVYDKYHRYELYSFYDRMTISLTRPIRILMTIWNNDKNKGKKTRHHSIWIFAISKLLSSLLDTCVLKFFFIIKHLFSTYFKYICWFWCHFFIRQRFSDVKKFDYWRHFIADFNR